MYIIGDLECLTAKGEVWRDVRAALKSVDAVGPALTLRCTEHPDQALRVTNAADFSVWRRGGCTVRCSSLLGCGHQCPEPCHRDNLEHYGVVRQCSGAPQHLCDRECGQECPECVVPVRKTLPGCGHEGTFPCAQPPAEAACTAPCVRKLPCGHPCKRRCGESCGGCDVPVSATGSIRCQKLCRCCFCFLNTR
ncbi:hypothetical protein ONE63_004495 [Megalurothrips usitatus]|uniref:NFX1-type zinc finger-containing protein 1-like n=1 Tax=Megalurothrips usitatus TaxID=439358 RepID=A0AAV7X6E1_9NEOP|nr:hypothetical protein ONE63_004495 [Megalurothrips usitatus]